MYKVFYIVLYLINVASTSFLHLVGCFEIDVTLAIFHAYRDLEAGDN